MNHTKIKAYYNSVRETLKPVKKYEVLHMLLRYHFNYDIEDTIDVSQYPHLDFRCLSPNMLDEIGHLNRDEELLILMYYKDKFSGVLKYSRKSPYPHIEVYYTNNFKSILFIGEVAQLYADETGSLLNDEIIENLQSHIVSIQNNVPS